MADYQKFSIDYRHEGSEWGVTFYARDLDDAKRKFRAMAANGEVVGPVYQMPVPGFLPPWLVTPFLSLICTALNVWSSFKKWMRS